MRPIRPQLIAIRQTVARIRGLRVEVQEATAALQFDEVRRLNGMARRFEADVLHRLDQLEASGDLMALEAVLPLCLGGAPVKEVRT